MEFSKRITKNAGISSGIIGIICNLLLSGMKFFLGSLSGSVSITADAANNLSDAGSSIVTIIGAALARKPADRDHPFGHGRAESISALVVAILILLTGIELGKSSILRIIHPQPVSFQWVYLIALAVSIAVKLFLALFNRGLYRRTQLESLKAVAQDSLNDCLATGAALLALVLGHHTGIGRLDGIAGLFVSVFVLFSGIDLVKSFSGILLGRAPSEELVGQIKAILLNDPRIVGIHDLYLHDYGPNQRIGSVHAEVSAELGAVAIHEIIDGIEDEILRETGTHFTIHIDPIDPGNLELRRFKDLTRRILGEYNPDYRFHDLKLRHDADCTRLVFDLVVPYEEKKKAPRITSELQALFSKESETIRTEITVEHEL